MPGLPNRTREQSPNPIVGAYLTSDGRAIQLVMLQSDRYWNGLCAVLNRPDLANGFVRTVEGCDGSTFELIANPVQFDETPPTLVRAPEMGEHTELVLLERGCSWDQLAQWKDDGVIT
jgi:crotonobetainyl-CoA:carnitine CoA-transferase CaiB-like acyl-CoA transferase